MAREPIPTWYFALVVVRKDDRFLVVQERRHDEFWYLPAGRIEPGESLAAGARRETIEETGIPVFLEGIYSIQYTPLSDGTARLRIVFVARPLDETPPKSVPDENSLRAAWVTLDELDQLPLRDQEVRTVFRAIAGGASIAPLGMLGAEEKLLGRS
jgi:phosphatase NudJ